MAFTVATSNSASAWRPDTYSFLAADVLPDALILQCSTVAGEIIGDAPSLKVAYITDDDADFVSEGSPIPEGDPTLSEAVVFSSKVSKLLRITSEQYRQAGTPAQLAASAARAVTRKADQAFISQAAPVGPAVAPSAGLLNVAGIVDGGAVGTNLDALVDLIAELQVNLADRATSLSGRWPGANCASSRSLRRQQRQPRRRWSRRRTAAAVEPAGHRDQRDHRLRRSGPRPQGRRVGGWCSGSRVEQGRVLHERLHRSPRAVAHRAHRAASRAHRQVQRHTTGIVKPRSSGAARSAPAGYGALGLVHPAPLAPRQHWRHMPKAPKMCGELHCINTTRDGVYCPEHKPTQERWGTDRTAQDTRPAVPASSSSTRSACCDCRDAPAPRRCATTSCRWPPWLLASAITTRTVVVCAARATRRSPVGRRTSSRGTTSSDRRPMHNWPSRTRRRRPSRSVRRAPSGSDDLGTTPSRPSPSLSPTDLAVQTAAFDEDLG